MMRCHAVTCLALALAGCMRASTGKVPMSQVVASSDADFATVHIKLSHIGAQSPIGDVHKPVFTLAATTNPSSLQLAAFEPHHSPNVGYLDEFGVREIVLAPRVVRELVDSLASAQGLASSSLPHWPALSVIVIRSGQGGTRASEVFIDAGQARRLAALVTDGCIGTRYFETCAHWENNVP
jgi:hypothetical protein